MLVHLFQTSFPISLSQQTNRNREKVFKNCILRPLKHKGCDFYHIYIFLHMFNIEKELIVWMYAWQTKYDKPIAIELSKQND